MKSGRLAIFAIVAVVSLRGENPASSTAAAQALLKLLRADSRLWVTPLRNAEDLYRDSKFNERNRCIAKAGAGLGLVNPADSEAHALRRTNRRPYYD